MKTWISALTAALLSLGLAACSAAPATSAATAASARTLSSGAGSDASLEAFQAKLDAIVEDARDYAEEHPLFDPEDLTVSQPDMDRAARTVDNQLTLDFAAVDLDHTVENTDDTMTVTVMIPDGSQRAQAARDDGDPDGDWQGMEDSFTHLCSDIYDFFADEDLPDVTITVNGVDADSQELLLSVVNGTLTQTAG